jgi:hypothetical protein
MFWRTLYKAKAMPRFSLVIPLGLVDHLPPPSASGTGGAFHRAVDATTLLLATLVVTVWIRGWLIGFIVAVGSAWCGCGFGVAGLLALFAMAFLMVSPLLASPLLGTTGQVAALMSLSLSPKSAIAGTTVVATVKLSANAPMKESSFSWKAMPPRSRPFLPASR